MRFSYFLIISMSFGLLASSKVAPLKIPETLIMETLSGEEVVLKDYLAEKGKVTVINCWSSWCNTCRASLDSIHATYYYDWKHKYKTEFIVVNLDYDSEKETVKRVVDYRGWEFDVLLNSDKSIYPALGFQEIPYTLILDQNGNIVYRHKGYEAGDEKEFDEVVKNLAK